jgi:hypothetical protein
MTQPTDRAGLGGSWGAAPGSTPGAQEPRRLPTWVNVVLVLILLASCGGASRNDVDSGSVATQVVQQLQSDQTDNGGVASRDDVTQLCRLLAAVAAKQGVDAAELLGNDLGTACDDGVRGR